MRRTGRRERLRLLGIPGLLVILLLAAGAAADIHGPQPYTGLPLLTAAPLAAAAMLSFRASVAVVLLSGLVSVSIDLYQDRPLASLIVDLADVGAVGTIALVVNVVLARQSRRLAGARSVAAAAQQALLPEPPERVGPLAVAARYVAAHAEARIGGDLYAVQPTPFGVRGLIGDVRGKGLESVGIVSVVIGAFRQEAEHAETLEEVALRLDAALERDFERRGAAAREDFTTALLVQFSPDGGTVHLVNRGHPAPYLVNKGAVTRLDIPRHDPPLGLGLPADAAGTPAGNPAGNAGNAARDIFPLPSGASLLLVTDGITEARNSVGAFYDPCAAGLGTSAHAAPEETLDALVRDVFRWTGGPNEDDMAVLALTRVQ